MCADQVKIRNAEPQDRAVVMELADRLMTGVAPWRDPAAARQAVRSWVAESLDAADPETRPVLVAVRDDAVLGFVTTSTRSHWAGEVAAYVGELVVAEDAASQGVGRQLMNEAESWARRSGHRRLTIETGAANTAARRFYAAAGYAEEEVVLSKELQGTRSP